MRGDEIQQETQSGERDNESKATREALNEHGSLPGPPESPTLGEKKGSKRDRVCERV